MRRKHSDHLSTTSKVWIKEMTLYQGTVSTTIGSGNDPVNHPNHYTSHPSGVEVIQITEHMNFCLGNAIKYILRAEHKGKQIEDLKKAAWYINREIERLESL
jgi:hypothetical protein